jgi:hypothetical protein
MKPEGLDCLQYNQLSLNKSVFRLLFLAFLFLISCSEKPKHESPANYDFSRPKKIIMKDDLLEISGITFLEDSLNLVLAINDEQGKIFVFDSLKKKPEYTRFSKSADYEDLAISNRTIFVLRSDGTLFSVPADSILHESVSCVEWKEVLPKGEYESIHARNNTLYVLCKSCGKEKKHISGYALELNQDSITFVKPFAIDIESIREEYDLKFGFKASALAWNVKTSEWFIISSVNKLLMITDGEWNIKNVYPLSPKTFIQPEGIAFDQYQNLYVSNEGNETRNGNILKFTFRTKKKE